MTKNHGGRCWGYCHDRRHNESEGKKARGFWLGLTCCSETLEHALVFSYFSGNVGIIGGKGRVNSSLLAQKSFNLAAETARVLIWR